MAFTYPQQQGHPLSAKNERRAIQIKSNSWVHRTLVRVDQCYRQKVKFVSLLTKMVKLRYSLQCSKLDVNRTNYFFFNPRSIWKLHTKSQTFQSSSFVKLWYAEQTFTCTLSESAQAFGHSRAMVQISQRIQEISRVSEKQFSSQICAINSKAMLWQ